MLDQREGRRGVQVTPTEFRLLAACYREDIPNGVWTITPTEVGGIPQF